MLTAFSSTWRRPCASIAVASSSSSVSAVGLISSGRRESTDATAGKKFVLKKGKGEKWELMQTRRKNNLALRGIKAFQPLPPNQLSVPILSEGKTILPDAPIFGQDVLSEKVLCKAVQFSSEAGSPVKAFGVPRNVLIDFRLLSKPCSIVRNATLDLVKRLEGASTKPSSESRWVLTGPSGCGKSYLLLQSVVQGAANGWIVLYFPRASKMIDSSTPYAYDHRTQTYLQPFFAQQTLQRLLNANKSALESLRTSQTISVERRVPFTKGALLSEVIAVGLKEQQQAPTVLSAVIDELGLQTSFPVLVAVDDFQALYNTTEYRDQHYEKIQPYHLSMPRLIMEIARGKRSFARGAFLGAVSVQNTGHPLSVELRTSLKLDADRPISPYERRSEALMEYLDGLEALPVPAQLGYDEAASIFDVWKRDGALHTIANDELFLSKFSEASGNARAFVHGGLLASLTT